MIARRERFQRVYDLRERVLPDPVPRDLDDARLPSRDDALRQLTLLAVHALGVTTARWVGDYFRTGRRETAERVRALAAEGALVTARVEEWDEPAFVHPNRLELARRAADGAIPTPLTTLLSPFDPLVWDRERARVVFDFDYRLECYTPAPKRRYGYFVLPILRRGRLVGRLDAKAHRKDRQLAGFVHSGPSRGTLPTMSVRPRDPRKEAPMGKRSVAALGGTMALLVGLAAGPVEVLPPEAPPTIRGEGVCDTSGPLGQYMLSWAVINPQSNSEITILSATESGAYEGQVYLDSTHLGAGESATGVDGPVPGTLSGTVTLTVDYVVNATGEKGEARGRIQLAGDCGG